MVAASLRFTGAVMTPLWWTCHNLFMVEEPNALSAFVGSTKHVQIDTIVNLWLTDWVLDKEEGHQGGWEGLR